MCARSFVMAEGVTSVARESPDPSVNWYSAAEMPMLGEEFIHHRKPGFGAARCSPDCNRHFAQKHFRVQVLADLVHTCSRSNSGGDSCFAKTMSGLVGAAAASSGKRCRASACPSDRYTAPQQRVSQNLRGVERRIADCEFFRVSGFASWNDAPHV